MSKNKIYTLDKMIPTLGKECFIAPTAVVLGDVHLGDHVSIWFHTVLRGDVNSITVGNNVNIQDLSMLHVDEDAPLMIEDNVSIGHKVLLHGCHIGASTLVGMGAIVMDGVEVGENCLVAAGSLLPPGKKYPPGSMIMGSPARVVRSLTDQEQQQYGNHYALYFEYKKRYLKQSNLDPQEL